MHPRSLFSLAEHLERLSKDGDPLEVLAGTVEFERFRPLLVQGLGYSDGAKGGRPPFDPVAMFKVLVVQAQHNLSDARMEFMIRDRLSWMRFFGFDLGGAMPDENTIRHYRNRLTTSGTLEALMQLSSSSCARQDIWRWVARSSMMRKRSQSGGLASTECWCLRPGSAIPRMRRPRSRRASRPGRSGAASRTRRTKRMSDARWTVKIGGKIRYCPDGTPLPQIATPVFGYKSHISIDRRFGFIRKAAVTSASDSDGRQLRRVIDTSNTASDVWADSACRSARNEAWLKAHMLKSRIHRRKPKGRPMPEHMAHANAAKSAIRARVEHVFAHQKNRYGLFIRTIGIARAQAKLTLANLAYNFDRLIFHERCAATG